MEKYNLDKIIKENLNKTKFQSKNQPSLHVKGWLDEYQGGGTYLSDKAKATQFGQYKKGGGYFPEYHSFAPPREAYGGRYQEGGFNFLNVPEQPSAQIFQTAPYNLEHFEQYAPEYKKTYGIPRINSGDTFDKFKHNLIDKGVHSQEATNIADFMTRNYNTEGKLKDVPFFRQTIKGTYDPNFLEPIDDSDKGDQRRRSRPAPGKMGEDYYANGGWLDEYQNGGYVVKKGESLSIISKKTGVPVATLAKLNSIKDIDKIGVGQSLILPGGGAKKSPLASALVPKVTAQPVQQKGVPFGVYAPNQPVQNNWPYTNKPAVKKTQPAKQPVPQTGTPLVYAPNQPVQGAWPYVTQQPAAKVAAEASANKTPKSLPAKKVDNSGMEAIRAYNAANNTIPYQENAQQAQLNPTKKKHTLKDLRASVENIPSNWTFGLPMNVTNFIKNHIAPNSSMAITNDNLSDEQKAILLQTIKRAQQRNKGALSGGADYIDYPTTIGQSAQGFMNNPTKLPQYIGSAEGQLATTLGGFTYNQDPETGEYIVTDKYNFSNARDKSREGKEGTGLTGKLRKMADADEAKNLAGQKDSYWGAGANRRVGIILNPKTMAKRQHGGWLDQYADGGDMITDPMGQWAHPGQNTRIPGNNITMQGVPYPVLAKANNGMTTMMYPGQEYSFPGASHVDEYPAMQNGGWLSQYADEGLEVTTQTTRAPIEGDWNQYNRYTDSLNAYNTDQKWEQTLDNLKNKKLTRQQIKSQTAAFTVPFANQTRLQLALNNLVVKDKKGIPVTDKKINIQGTDDPTGQGGFGFYSLKYVKPVQPINKPKPKSTVKPKTVVPATKIAMGKPSTGMQIQQREMPKLNIPPVQKAKYKVDYFDPTEGTDVQGGWHTKSFMSDKEASDYMTQRRNDNKFYGTSMTQRVEYKNGGWLDAYL